MRPANRVLRLGALGTFGAIAFLAALRWSLQHAKTRARGQREKRAPDASVRAAIARANRSYLDALIHNDAFAYAQIFAEDCLYMPPAGPPARGRAAVEANVAATLQLMRFNGGVISTLELYVHGDCAYEVGIYRLEAFAEGSQKTLRGRYIGVWKRVDREWKLAVDFSQPEAAAMEKIL